MELPEEWRDVVGYEGWYQVSDMGRVRRVAAGKGAKPGMVLKPTEHDRGYQTVVLSREYVKHRRYIHRLVAGAFIGDCPVGYEVNHRNGNREDNRLVNLEYVTPSENILHSINVTKTGTFGENHPSSKLSESKVREIRGLLDSGFSQNRVAQTFGVSRGTICDISTGKTWKHVD